MARNFTKAEPDRTDLPPDIERSKLGALRITHSQPPTVDFEHRRTIPYFGTRQALDVRLEAPQHLSPRPDVFAPEMSESPAGAVISLSCVATSKRSRYGHPSLWHYGFKHIADEETVAC